MKMEYLYCEGKKEPLRIELADSWWGRFRGLMLRQELPQGQGLLIAPCSSIHMCFMRFAIDAVYIDASYRVLKVVHRLRPWIGLSACWHAWAVLEMTAGTAEQYGISAGMQLRS
jgi:uncharacterized membrane protein (UPF0127 family)